MKSSIHFWSYLAHFFLEWEMFHTSVAEKIETHILCLVTFFFFRKCCRLWNNVEKFCRAGQVTDENMVHAHSVLDIKGYKYTHSGGVILVAFPLQQWLHERASMLRYTYIACRVQSTAFLHHGQTTRKNPWTCFVSIQVFFTCDIFFRFWRM